MRIFLLMVTGAICALAQIDGLNTNASRTVVLTPDQAVFSVDVITDAGSSIEQAADAVKEAGVSSGNLLSIVNVFEYRSPDEPPRPMRFAYQFEVVHPYSKLKDVTDKLEAAKKKLVASGGDIQFSVNVAGSEKAFLEIRRDLIPQLIQEARKQADFLAAAAGMNLGNILSVSESVYSAVGPGYSIPYYGGIMGSSSAPGSSSLAMRLTVTVYARFAAQAR